MGVEQQVAGAQEAKPQQADRVGVGVRLLADAVKVAPQRNKVPHSKRQAIDALWLYYPYPLALKEKVSAWRRFLPSRIIAFAIRCT